MKTNENKSDKQNKIKVMIIDDSAVVRQSLNDLLNSDPNIKVIATAADPFFAAEKIKKDIPDVIILDIEMPRMDGLTFLQKIMTQYPIPVVICSSLAEKGSATALKAIDYGAIEIIQKPKVGTKIFFEDSKIQICDVVKAASLVQVKSISKPKVIEPKYNADVVIVKPKPTAMIKTTEKVVMVGASTGGTEALRIFLEDLPLDCPGIVIVQHMPEKFTERFAQRLDSICNVSVMEAKNNDTVLRGRVLIAPGNKHTLLKRSGARYYVEIKDGPLVCRHRPSVDVLFRSAARYAGPNGIGIILTGMGDDGAKGLLEMKEAGAFTIAQDKSSCVVFGMPNEAIQLGAASAVLPLQNISTKMLKESAQ